MKTFLPFEQLQGGVAKGDSYRVNLNILSTTIREVIGAWKNFSTVLFCGGREVEIKKERVVG